MWSSNLFLNRLETQVWNLEMCFIKELQDAEFSQNEFEKESTAGEQNLLLRTI